MILRFYSTGFKPEQNGVYENVAQYLSSLTPVRTLTNVKTFGYFDLREIIRIDMDSHDNQFDGVSSIGDYVEAIDDAAEYPVSYFYFILNYTWKGKQTVELELSMDTLTTFWDKIKDNLSNQTHITRRLKNRWYTTSSYAFPVVDKFAEPFTPAFAQTSSTQITDAKTALSGKWYLVWSSKVFDITQSTDASVDVTPSAYTLIPESSKVCNLLVSPFNTLTFATIPCGNTGWFAITNALAPGGKIKSKTDGTTLVTLSENHWAVIALSETGKLLVQDRSTSSSEGQQYEINSAGITFEGIDVIYRQTGMYPWKSTAYDYANLIYTSPLNVNSEEITMVLDNFENWYGRNSTDSSIIKIMEFPYCPTDLSLEEGVIQLDPETVATDGFSLVLRSTTDFKHFFSLQSYSTLKLTKDDVAQSIGIEEAPSAAYETKLLNSACGGYTVYVYDTQSWMVRPELMSKIDDGQVIEITQLVSPQSGQITFTFTSDQQKTEGDDWFISSSRLNEKPVFSSSYVEYLKYGNALDQKRLNATMAQGALSGVSAGLGAFATIALATAKGAAAGSAGGPVGTVAAAVAGAAVGVATAVTNIAVQTSQQHAQMDTNKRQMANTASQASAVNDLEIYNNLGYQCLRKLTYAPITGNKPIFNFFRLYGYATDEYSVPDFNTRRWYDFVQCEPVFKRKFTWKDREEDIVERMKLGFTIFHYHSGTTMKYDLNKTLENWEQELVTWANE